MHHLPTLLYSGLTIILDHPSRFDKTQLLSGYSGQFFESCIYPFSRNSCDIRCASSNNMPLLPNTKVLLLLGEDAHKLYNDKISLNDSRGCPNIIGDKIVISSYAPQDAFDRRDYETDEENENETDNNSDKDHQKTKRRNWRFWLHYDTRKCVRILQHGISQPPIFNARIYPSAENVIEVLETTKGGTLFLDIETRRDFTLSCFGFKIRHPSSSRHSDDCYVVPFWRYNGELAYDKTSIVKIIRALGIAIKNNKVVAHNAMFDLFILAYKYRIPFPRDVFCTMLGFHRCFPETEKSLGHIISFLTDLPYHKGEGVFDPKNIEQEYKCWRYNALDVHTLSYCYDELLKLIAKLDSKK